MKDNLYTGQESREKLISGIRKIASAVGGTMGTGGANSIIERIESPHHLITNDGYTIASSIKLSDPTEEMGRNILMEAINRANKNSGDGSSTTCVLTASILEEGMKHLSEASPMEIKNSLEACIPLIEESINKQKRDIEVNEVGAVASISAEDEKIGVTIQEIYEKIGKKGLIYWDVSKTSEDTYTIGSGITIDGAGYVSPYMCDLDEKTGGFLNVARWKNPLVLITKQKITSAGEFEGLFVGLNNRDIKQIVIFCDEFEPNIIPDLIKTRVERGFRALIVKMPILWKDQWYQDLAKVSGATIIDPSAGLPLKEIKMEHLGKVGNIIVSKEDTFIDGIKDVSEYVSELEAEGTDDSKLRASRLNTKTARYFVGAHSESALSYRRLKVEDAISAAYHALNGGICLGGGVALFNTSKEFGEPTIGKTILSIALEAPIRQIIKNANGNVDNVIASIRIPFNERGFDTKQHTIVNMWEAQITDPAVIVFNAVKNAISVAASVLTVDSVVLFPRQEQVQLPPIVR